MLGGGTQAEARAARRWIAGATVTLPGFDFATTCDALELDEDAVRVVARRLIAAATPRPRLVGRHARWRRPAKRLL